MDADTTGERRIRVLVVEDHPDTAHLFQRALERAGFDVATAGSAAEALAAVARQPFDVMLSDLGLPDASGHELMVRVKALQPLVGIAMSGYGEDEDIEKSRVAGFSEHLVKPITVDVVVAVIRRLT
jgi:CheY-like chemotaxis protein